MDHENMNVSIADNSNLDVKSINDSKSSHDIMHHLQQHHNHHQQQQQQTDDVLINKQENILDTIDRETDKKVDDLQQQHSISENHQNIDLYTTTATSNTTIATVSSTEDQSFEQHTLHHHRHHHHHHASHEANMMDDDGSTHNNENHQVNSSTPKKSRIAAIPGKPRGATYDGNACMICSDRASGFHYGVLACEGCKGFFKRICKEPNDIQTKRHCVYGGNCDINLRTRNRCQYCRIQKCLQLGMSKDGIKLGRRSRKFKENLIQIVSSPSSSLTTQTVTASTSNMSHLTPLTTSTSSAAATTPTASSSSPSNATNLFHQIDLLSKTVLNDVNKIGHTDLLNSHQLQQLAANCSNNNNNPNNNHGNNSFITINSESQIQQIILPSDQSHLNANKQVIAIIQDNRLIIKAIDIPQHTATAAISNTIPTAADAIAAVVSSTSTTSNSHINTKQELNEILEYHQNHHHLTNTNHNNNHHIEIQHEQLQQQQHPQPQQLQQTDKMSIYQILDTTQIQQINDSIMQAHKETWPYLKEKCKKIKQLYQQQSQTQTQQLKHRQIHLQLEQYFTKGLINFLNETKFLESFNQLIENTVLFAKIVPYFMDMHESDRIAMLKSCVFEIICVRHMFLFEQNFKLFLPFYELYISKEYLMQKFSDYITFIEALFDFHLNFFELFDFNDMEIAIFCSFLLFNTDDDVQLNDSEKLLTYRNLFRGLLINELYKNHSQQYKESDIQAWLDRCCLKLKNLNYEHSQILSSLKKSIQFPDLYAELYNL